jgi:hypothetical protein
MDVLIVIGCFIVWGAGALAFGWFINKVLSCYKF